MGIRLISLGFYLYFLFSWFFVCLVRVVVLPAAGELRLLVRIIG